MLLRNTDECCVNVRVLRPYRPLLPAPCSGRRINLCPAAAQALEPLVHGQDRLAADLAAAAAEERVWRAERITLQAALAGKAPRGQP